MTITNDIKYIGVNDHEVDLFEGQYVVPNGMSYNSYAIMDEKIAIMDTVDKNFTHQWLDNIQNTLGSRKPDYLIVQHMEPDHSANIANFLKVYPEATVVSSTKAFAMMQNFFGEDYADRRIVVGEGDTLTLGKHTLAFVTAPMVHWPEVMLSFDETEGILFSADAFGSYGAINGSIFADGKDFEKDLLGEARRYYTNIVGKYGMQTVAAINKASQLDIKMICPLHSYVWRKDIDKIINCYKTWGSYTPEVEGVFILTGSIYGHTANAAEVLMTELDKRGIDSVILDASATDISDIIAAAFTYSHIVIATPTYNNNVYSPVEHAVRELAAHGLTARSFSVIENGTWAPSAAKNILPLLEGLKNCKITGETVTIKSSGNDATRHGIEALAEAIDNDIRNK